MSREVRRFTPPEPPKTRRSGATRERLLKAAAELFLAHGYDAVSMNDVAEQAGVTKGGLYGHFRSKGQMLVEAIRWKHLQFEGSAEFAQDLVDPKTGIGLLWSAAGLEGRLLGVDAAAAARHDPDVLAGMTALNADRYAAVVEHLRDHTSDPEAVAWLILAFAAGIGVREAFGVQRPDAARLEPALARLIDALLG